MLRSLRHIQVLGAVLCLISPRALAGVLIVDTSGAPGTFSTIQAAINTAVDGDAILVKAGTYPSFAVVNESLTIAADAGANVQVQGAVRVRNLDADKTVVIVGLKSTGQFTAIPNDVYGFAATDNQGRVRAVWCEFRGAPGIPPVSASRDGYDGTFASNSVDVALSRCTSIGGLGRYGYTGGVPNGDPGRGGAGVRASQSAVTLHDCVLHGGNGEVGSSAPVGPGWIDGGHGGPAYRGQSASLFASKTIFAGGTGGEGGLPDCATASYGGTGGDALVLETAVDFARLISSTETPGAGGTWHFGCITTQPGTPGSARTGPGTFSDLPFAGRSMNLTPNPVRESTSLAITLNGVPGDRVAIIFSPTTTSVFNAQWNGQQMFPLPAAARFLILGFVPSNGTFTYNLGLSDLGPGVQAKTFFAQTLFDGTGGERVLGTAMPLLVLDSAF